MAFTVSDALREMAEANRVNNPPILEERQKVSKKPLTLSEKVDTFLIPEDFMKPQPRRIGYIKSTYYDLKDKFGVDALWPAKNLMTTDVYAMWNNITVKGVTTDEDDEGNSRDVFIEVVFWDTYKDKLSDLLNNKEVIWEVEVPHYDYQYANDIKIKFKSQYGIDITEKKPSN